MTGAPEADSHADDPVTGWRIVADMIHAGGFTVTSLGGPAHARRPVAVTAIQLDGDVVTTVDRAFAADAAALAAHDAKVRARLAGLRRFARLLRNGPTGLAGLAFAGTLWAITDELSPETPWRSLGYLATTLAAPALAALAGRATLLTAVRLLRPRLGRPPEND